MVLTSVYVLAVTMRVSDGMRNRAGWDTGNTSNVSSAMLVSNLDTVIGKPVCRRCCCCCFLSCQSQSVQVIHTKVPRLGHDRYLSNPFPFIFNQSHAIQRCILWGTDIVIQYITNNEQIGAKDNYGAQMCKPLSATHTGMYGMQSWVFNQLTWWNMSLLRS